MPQGVNFNVCELKVNGMVGLRYQDGCRADQRINCITNTDPASEESGEERSGPKLGWTRTLQTEELTEHHDCRWWRCFQEETGQFSQFDMDVEVEKMRKQMVGGESHVSHYWRRRLQRSKEERPE